MNRVYYPQNDTVRKQVRYYEDQQRQKMATTYKNPTHRAPSPGTHTLPKNTRPQQQPFFNPNLKVKESFAPQAPKPSQQTNPSTATPSPKIQQTPAPSEPQKSSSKLIKVSSKTVQNLVEKKETKQGLKKSKSKATIKSKSSQLLKPLSKKSSIKEVRKETKSKTSAAVATTSSTSTSKARRTLSVLEAAAKLSFPWTFASTMEARKQQVPEFELASPRRSQLVKEIRRFFASHQDLLPKSKSKRDVAHQLALEMEMDESLETVMQSLKVAYLQEEKSLGYYKPVVAPKWEEVETNWPGFVSKPLPNWMDYTKPSKIIPYKRNKSVGVKKVLSKAVEGTAGALIAKAKRQRILHHNGTCQL